MAMQITTLKDRRRNTRVATLMDCRFVYKDIAHGAVIVDLSQKGALVSSGFMPPVGENISLTIQSSPVKKSIMLNGKVSRNIRQGKTDRFVVLFDQCPLELADLITEYNSIQEKKEEHFNDW